MRRRRWNFCCASSNLKRMRLDRRRFFFVSSSAAFAATPLARLLAQAAAQAPAQAAAAPAVTPVFAGVRRNVGIFTARGGTIGYLINKDGVLVVDTQYPDTAKTCLDGVKQRDGGRRIDLVFNTHHHADHTGGNGVFKPETAKIVAHAKVPDLLKMVAASAPAGSAPPVFPDATFDNTWGDKIGDESFTASYDGPGHTSGDAIVHFERAHVVHMGDLLFYERHPRVDRPAGASIRNWIVILEKTAKRFPADTIYIAGHAKDGVAPTVDQKAVLRFRDYLTAALEFTRKGIAAGQTKDAIAAAPSLQGFEGYQGGGPLTLKGVLESAYDELTAKAP
jgi:glyoxylase-like metal-dependent hydrolase (beta-lactamase superfamily II)